MKNRLRVLMAERNLRIKDVVQDTGFSRNEISRLINHPEVNVRNNTLEKLCEYLKVTPNDFFGYWK